MKITEKRMEKDIKNYIRTLKIFLRKKGNKINIGNPNDKHLRTYIKNIYQIKLLFPETLDIELSHDRKKILKFIKEFKINKEKIINKSTNKLNRTNKFVIK